MTQTNQTAAFAPDATVFAQTHIPPKSDFEMLLEKDFTPQSTTERFLLHRDMYWWQAERFHASRMYASKFPTVELLFAAMMYGLRFGWHPVTSLDNLYPVKEKMTPSTQSMLGHSMARGGGAKLVIKESGKKGQPGFVGEWCEVSITRVSNGEVFETRWDADDVKRAGLDKPSSSGAPSMHSKYPATMKRWRCIADALKVLFADLLSGVVTFEEMIDGDDDDRPKGNGRLPTVAEIQTTPAADGSIPAPPLPANVPSPLEGAAAPRNAPPQTTPGKGGELVQSPPSQDSLPTAGDASPQGTPAKALSITDRSLEFSQNASVYEMEEYFERNSQQLAAAKAKAGYKGPISEAGEEMQRKVCYFLMRLVLEKAQVSK